MTHIPITQNMIDTILDLPPDGHSTAEYIMRAYERLYGKRVIVRSDELEPLYQRLLKTANTPLGEQPLNFQLHPAHTIVGDPVVGVIVEARAHPGLEFVVCQFADQLNINIQLFHSEVNEGFILNSRIGELVDQGRVQLSNLGIDRLDRRSYNALLMSKQFWQAVCGRRKILVFQTDTILCTASAYTLDTFTGFDYIGSRWNRSRPVGLLIDGGNGGLSLRDWAHSIRCIEQYPGHFWPGGEDGYFAFHMELQGANVAKTNSCGKFSSQEQFNPGCFGAHKISDMNDRCLRAFLEYCPEAASLLLRNPIESGD